jgi:hypothetical protein
MGCRRGIRGCRRAWSSRAVTRRRTTSDPLTEFRHLPHWLTVSDQHGVLLESQPLQAGTDLRAVVASTMASLAAVGWAVEGDARYGFFRVNRHGTRHFVHLRPTDPTLPIRGQGYSPTRGA